MGLSTLLAFCWKCSWPSIHFPSCRLQHPVEIFEDVKDYMIEHIIEYTTEDGRKKCGADKFISEKKEIGVYGTACLISTLVTCKEPNDSDDIINCADTITSEEFKINNGGYATSSVKETCGCKMILPTCYVLNALLPLHNKELEGTIRMDFDWLLKQMKDASKLWGYYEGDIEGRIISSCIVILTIMKAKENGIDIKKCNELFKVINEKLNYYISGLGDDKIEERVAKTSLLTLVMAYNSEEIENFIKGINYLRENSNGIKKDVAKYRIPYKNKENRYKTEHYSVYIREIIVLAMLKGGIPPWDTFITDNVKKVILDLKDEIKSEKNASAISIMYFCLTLREYINCFNIESNNAINNYIEIISKLHDIQVKD